MKSTFSALLFVTLVIVGCHRVNYSSLIDERYDIYEQDGFEYMSIRPYTSKDSVTIKLKVYEINNELAITLDSIVNIAYKFANSLYKKEVKLDFSFYVSSSVAEENEIAVCISAFREKDENVNYGSYDKIFFYNGERFFYEGLILDSIIKPTKRKIRYRCVDSKRFVINGYSDPDCYWCYIYEDKKLKNSFYPRCRE